MSSLIKQHLHHSKARMKKQADQNRTERRFSVGDMVFLKLQPYVQSSSLATRSNQKLTYKYFRPYKILSRVGQVSYRLPTKFFSNSSYVSCFATKTNCWLFSPGYPIGSGCS